MGRRRAMVLAGARPRVRAIAMAMDKAMALAIAMARPNPLGQTGAAHSYRWMLRN